MGTQEQYLLFLFCCGCPDLRVLLAHHSQIIWDERAGASVPARRLYLHASVQRFLTAYVCDKNPEFAIGLVPLLGIGFHSFLDGVVYSITFSASIFTGMLAAIGMVLHEFPEGIITYLLLLRGGGSSRQALWLAFLAAAVSTPLGTLLSYPMISRIDPSLLGALLSVSAGALIYVGATHLLPQAERESAKYSLVALAAGILVAAGIIVSNG